MALVDYFIQSNISMIFNVLQDKLQGEMAELQKNYQDLTESKKAVDIEIESVKANLVIEKQNMAKVVKY